MQLGSTAASSYGAVLDGNTITLTFEGFADLQDIADAYSDLGVTFTAGHILKQGGWLNSRHYPPRSGVGVAANVYDYRIAMSFQTPVSHASAYVTAYYPAAFRCYREDGSLVGYVAVPTPNLANHSESVAEPNYYVRIDGSGITSCELVGSPDYITLDDLSFVHENALSCPPSVERGQEVRCVVTSANVSVTGWEFVPDSASLETVRLSSTSKVWKGPAAMGGTVTAYVSDGTTLEARFAVTDRPSPWKSKWSYRWGPDTTATAIPVTVSNRERDGGTTWAENCADWDGDKDGKVDCGGPWVQPYYLLESAAGYTGREIPSGPNQGYWYVAEKKYVMKRVANANPTILPTDSTYRWPVPADIAKNCYRALGFGPKDQVVANFYQYNEKCRGINMSAFLNGVKGHEEYGYNGGTGHMGLAEQEAGKPENDPYYA
ncbi:MAG: hypothetical protein M3220_16375, partial [Chloroflexota bacterium]|nr:hypothetical protein [Chloroflexota bacterium]